MKIWLTIAVVALALTHMSLDANSTAKPTGGTQPHMAGKAHT